MKRLQIMIEEEMDSALAAEALRRGTSKAALIREYVGENIKPWPPFAEDPLWEMAGVDDYELTGESIDDTAYG